MKVLLVHSYFLGLDQAEQKVMKPYPPLGILYLSAWLKQAGHDVAVFDGTFSDPTRFSEQLRQFEPEVVGFYANMMTRHHVLNLRSLITDPKTQVVVGGPDPPHYADAYLDHGFDLIIVGEGERSFSQWLAVADRPNLWSGIEGLVYRLNGETIHTAAQKPTLPIDEFPMPDRQAIDMESYLGCWERHHGVRPISLITSRGCPYQCTWCSHNVYGYSLRKRSAENVLTELTWIQEHYRTDRYWYADDVFTIDPKWIRALRELLGSKDSLRKPFECISRADRLNDEMVDSLAALNCARVWVGAESGSQRLLDLMKRGIKRDQVIAAVHRLRQVNIETGMFFMWGFMDEKLEDVLDTISLAAACEPDIALTTVGYPIKGTKFHDQLDQQGWLGETPDFATGTDRDIPIMHQADRDLYAIANQLLTATLQERKARRGSLGQQLRAPLWRLRGLLAQQRLRQGFRKVSYPSR